MNTPLLLFLLSFLGYLTTMSGAIPAYRDSGDLISAIYTLGIAHPPGYPLYILLGKLFTALIPFGNLAFRVNLLSGFCAACAVSLVYVVMRRQFLSREPLGAATGAAILFALTPAVVSLARVSEMYTLAAVFGVVIMLLWRIGSPQSLCLASFLLGLGFGVHPTLLFLAPLLFTLQPRTAATRVLFFALGFSIVLTLWVRAHAGPVQNWGNPSTLESLWRLITRSNYGGLKLHPVESEFAWTLGGVGAQLVFFIKTLWQQWGWIGLSAGLFGLSLSYKKDLRLWVCWCLAGPFFMVLSNLPLDQNTTAPILQPYFVLLNLIWTVWVAYGFWGVAIRLRGLLLPRTVMTVLVVVSCARAMSMSESQRHDLFAYDLGRNFLRTLPPGAVLYDPDDSIAFTLRSLQLIEHRQPDVVLLNFFRTRWGYEQIVHRWPDLLPGIPIQNGQELERTFWTYSIKRRPFYVDLPAKLPSGMAYDSEGIVYRARTSAHVPSAADLERAERYFQFYAWRGDWHTTRHDDFFTQHAIQYWASARCNLGLKYAERGDWPAARRSYREAIAIDPGLSVAYNNLGVADFTQNKFAAAVSNYRKALEIEPRNAGYGRNLALAQQQLPSEK